MMSVVNRIVATILVLGVWCPVPTNAQLCSRFLAFLNIDEALACSCDLNFGSPIGLDVSCAQPDGESNFCFYNLFCGQASFDLKYTIPGGLNEGTICIENTQVDPDEPITALNNFCLTASGRRGIGQGFRRCTVDIEGLDCSCTPCDGGYSYTIDCGENKPYVECFGFNSFA